MSKSQTFRNKVGKKKETGKNHIKLIRTSRAARSGGLRFYEEMVRVPDGENADSLVKELLSKEA